MMRRVFAIMVVLVVTRSFSFDGVPQYDYGDVSLFVESHWQTFSNSSRFHEFYSIKNLPPQVYRGILTYQYAPLTTNDFRLAWAASDGTNYIVHWKPDFDSVSFRHRLQEVWFHDYLTVAIPEVRSTNFVILTGSSNPLKDYKAFIDYEQSEAVNELNSEMSGGSATRGRATDIRQAIEEK